MTPKEMFYHGHLGGSALEIVSLMACSVCFMYLRTMYGKNRDSLLVDFFMIVVPMVLRLTVWSEFYLIDVTMMVISFASYFLLSSPSKEHNGGSTKHLVWVSLYRSFLMIITCICILAVDFPVFPRRFSKTEEFGISVMDVGIGSFMFSQGVMLSLNSKKKNSGFTILALLFLGPVRVLMTYFFSYHGHASEYGTHWNFFFTLAVTRFLAIPFLSSNKSIKMGIGVGLGLVYQAVLLLPGVMEYLLHSVRGTSLFSHNREGILGTLGHLSVLFIASSISTFSMKELGSFSSFCFFVSGILHLYIQQCSRRLTNLSYVMFIVGLNTMLITLIKILFKNGGDKRKQENNGIFLLEMVSRNSLAVFLVSNLMTGLINVLMGDNTINTSNDIAVGLLLLYSMGVCSIPIVIKKIKKFR